MVDVQAVILAGGYSSRAGAFKMELDFLGKPVLQCVIETMQSVCSSVIVVGGYQFEKIERLVEDYKKVKLVYNENYDEGMFSSVKKGIREVSAERFFLTPGDYPLINEEICLTLLKQEGDIIIPRFKQRGGHPILVNSKYIEEILGEPDTSNLKCYLSKKQRTIVEINDKGILLDIDTMEDYKEALNYQIEREKESGSRNKVD